MLGVRALVRGLGLGCQGYVVLVMVLGFERQIVGYGVRVCQAYGSRDRVRLLGSGCSGEWVRDRMLGIVLGCQGSGWVVSVRLLGLRFGCRE